jgi:hypothetical protein
MLICHLRPVMGERIEAELQSLEVELVPVVEQLDEPRVGRSALPTLPEVHGPPPVAQA